MLVAAAIALGACGSSNTSSSTSSASSAAATTTGSGGAVAAAKQKCLDATKQIQNQVIGPWRKIVSTARSTAEQACNQISTSNANVGAALNKAKQACLTAAAKIPIASVKQAFDGQCDKIAGS
jgi:hypothetical protein